MSNEIRLKGSIRFPPVAFGTGVRVVIVPAGESAGVDVVCWASDAPEATAVLRVAHQGDTVSVLGKLSRSKEKRLGKLDASGVLQPGDVYVASVSVLKARVDAAAPPAVAPSDDDDDLQF